MQSKLSHERLCAQGGAAGGAPSPATKATLDKHASQGIGVVLQADAPDANDDVSTRCES